MIPGLPTATVYGGSPFPPVPSRADLCGGQCTFQGLTCQTQQWGTLPMFEPAVNWLDLAEDRAAWYAVKRAAGDTIANMALASNYDEPNQAYTHIPGKDFAYDLPGLRARIVEALTVGGMRGIWLMLAGDGENQGPFIYGQPWLMQNFARIVDGLRGDGTVGTPTGDLNAYIVHIPGYDGVVPAWQPASQVDDFFTMARRVLGPSGHLGLELSAGYSSWGDGGSNWTSPAGQAIDLVLQEFPYPMGPPTPPPPNICDLPNDQKAPYYQVWQILARMIAPYVWPSDEPDCADSRRPPFYLGPGTPRGPFFYNAYEFDTYGWVRWCSLEQVLQHRQALRAMGCRYVG